ncbi:MAG: PilT/PilU family type 4a pilus ATPase [Phycisphaerae bacterium]|nr:PilT/PilU family type 4a pilus ATPase [Phycisphaerae bacterium]
MEEGLLQKLFDTIEEHDGSDIHLTANEIPYFRVHGKIARPRLTDAAVLTADDIERIIQPTLNEQLRKKYEENGYVDYAYEATRRAPGKPERMRYRIQLYRCREAPAVAFRRVKSEIPTFAQLNLPPLYEKAITMRRKGIIVIGGETGSGKSTTLASMLDYINEREAKHIVTIEDPIEYVVQNKSSIINQRELGQDFPSFSEALIALVREDPDVIMIGEMRDAETVKTAITAAETGHLVLTSLHTALASQTFYRILNFFTPDERDAVRQNLSATLIAILNQMLVETDREDAPRVPATEALINTAAVRMYIERNEVEKLADIVAEGQGDMHDFNLSLKRLFEEQYIDRATALHASLNPTRLAQMLM